MKINLENFAFEYGKVVSLPTARVGNRSFSLDNKSGHVVRKWAIDDEVFKDRQEERCDYLMEVQRNDLTYYWIELKGKDLTKACKQVLSTINLVSMPDKIQHETRIITTGTNKIDIRSKDYQLLYKLMLKHGGLLKQHTLQAIEEI
jgi:hypothetical protein